MDWRIVFGLVLLVGLVFPEKSQEDGCTDIARDEETLLVFSTLGGGLTAVDPITSEVRWSVEDEPAIKVPSSSEFPVPQYFPDPRDGSLYQFGDLGGIKKLPFTIPQLVANAPCRSSDGILYSGKKSDAWFMIDPKTGRREKVFGFGGKPPVKESIGWATSRAVFLGRTQYSIMMYDVTSKDKKPWNVTFFDYTSHSMAPELTKDYEWIHLTASASGLTVTLDRRKGEFLWQRDLSSPVVAVFYLRPEGLLSVPFTTVSDDVLQNIVEYAREGNKYDFKLFQSLYVGENEKGIYAIPSLVDKSTAIISSDPPILLLEEQSKDTPSQDLLDLNNIFGTRKNNEVVVLGHYQMPKVSSDSKLNLPFAPNKQLVDNQNPVETIQIQQKQDPKIIPPPDDPPIKENTTMRTLKKNPKEIFTTIYATSKVWLDEQESKLLKLLLIILIATIIGMFRYMRSTVQELRQQSQSGSQTSAVQDSSGRKSGSSGSGSYQIPEELGDGKMRVGKITFSTEDVLGKGCEGTFVFRGTFEKRDVAVKRLLPECFTLADREVALLRESDAHENVVRYFCTEQDRQFRYIAVELCSATLQEFTEGSRVHELRSQISVLEVLRQATSGVKHLHSLNIVHRDLKPQNVLLSFANPSNSVRAMISDFGLCKKLNVGKVSFSRRSGITGTEGWIAPEMLKGQRTTTSVDIFSLGCVFYYVLTSGEHPFGDTMKRQANILSHESSLAAIEADDNTAILAEGLIRDMISKEPSRRPPASAILNHPVFWSEKRVLAFLQDISDRVEKCDFAAEPLKSLEHYAQLVVRDDWSMYLDYAITEDLRKFRGYQGTSVRDLLRALRNKKHHYHEVDPVIQSILGTIPVGFTHYWIKKFPRLLSHSYHAFQRCALENAFKSYYHATYAFSKPSYFSLSRDEIPVLTPKFLDALPKVNRNNGKSFPNFDRRQGEKRTPEQMKIRKGLFNFNQTQAAGGENDDATAADGLVNRKNWRQKPVSPPTPPAKPENPNPEDVEWTIVTDKRSLKH